MAIGFNLSNKIGGAGAEVFLDNVKISASEVRLELCSIMKEFLPYPFKFGSAVVLDGEIHILGSNNSDSYTKHYKLDKTTNTWISVSTLPYNFYLGSAVVLDGEIHILGGGDYDGSDPYGNTNHYKLDKTTNTWISVSTLPYKFRAGSAVVLDGEIHILGTNVGSSADQTNHYKLDKTTNTWISVSTLPIKFYSSSAVVLDDEIYILGGSSDNNYTGHYKLDKITNTWISVSTLPYKFREGSAVVLDGEFHILGAEDYPNNHYKLDKTTNIWISVSTLPYNFYAGSAVVLDGEIHILGGYIANNTSFNHFILNYKIVESIS